MPRHSFGYGFTGGSQQYSRQSGCQAYQSSSQTYTNGSGVVKVNLQSVGYDHLGEFDNTTNYRFQPKAAGLYLCFATVYWNSPASGRVAAYFYKNGSLDTRLTEAQGNSNDAVNSGTVLIELTPADYVEVFMFYSGTGSPTLLANSQSTQFRAARLA